MAPLRELIALSGEDNIQTYVDLIESDLKRHLGCLQEGMQQPDERLRAKSLHGIYQVAASFGLTSVLQMTSVLQEQNKAGSLSSMNKDELQAMERVVNESLSIILEQPKDQV